MNIRKSVIAGISVILAIFLIGILGKWESTYERVAYVESVNEGVAIFEDREGNLWSFETAECQKGNEVILTMKDTGTTEIQDDLIMEIKVVEE